MKLNNFCNLATLGLALTFAGAGCHKSLEDNQKIARGLTQQPTVPPGPGGIDTNAFVSSTTNTEIISPIPTAESFINMAENATLFEADTVHFAFDSSVVQKDDQPKASNVA